MDLIDGRLTAAAHRRLVQSAAEANMNMLRVWGGGIWEPRAWFDAWSTINTRRDRSLQFPFPRDGRQQRISYLDLEFLQLRQRCFLLGAHAREFARGRLRVRVIRRRPELKNLEVFEVAEWIRK